MAGKQKTPPGYIRIGKRYISLVFAMTVSAAIFAFLALYAAVLHPAIVQKRLQAQTMPQFRLDSPYLAAYTGNARLILPDGSLLYEGMVSDAAANGEGKLYKDGELIYEGGFESNEFSGRGRIYENGVLIYEGGMANNMRSGKGKLFTAEGSVLYEGDFEADEISGQGKFYENGVIVYSGGFLTGQYSGTGKLYDAGGGLRYEGDFAAGLYDGRGRLYENGVLKYEGEFTAGMYNGTGTEYNTETGYPVFSGKYSDNVRMQAGVLYDENGEPVIYTPEPVLRPEPLSLLGTGCAEVLENLKLAGVTVKELASDDAFLAADEEIEVIYSFGLLEDGTPGILSRIYYYGLAFVDGVVAGSDISDITGGRKSKERVTAAELLALSYSNSLWGRDAEASKLQSMVFAKNDGYTVTAFYLPPEPEVSPVQLEGNAESNPEEDAANEEPPKPVIPPEPSGRIVFLRVDYNHAK